MNFLITGGAGYIGIELVYALASDSNTSKIVIYDSMRRSNYNVFGGLRKIEDSLIDFIDSDILDNTTLQTAVDDADVIFHLAAEVPDQINGQRAYVFDQINNWGSSILSQCIERSDSKKKVIYLSSLQIFGTGEVDVSVDKPNPSSPYALSKLKAERHFLRLTNDGYHDVSILRCPSVYGYSKNLRLGLGINKLIFDANFKKKITIHGTPEYQAPHIYIEDLVGGLVKSYSNLDPGVGYIPFYNVTLDELVSVLNHIFGNIDIIYLEQDQPDNTQKIKSLSSVFEIKNHGHESFADSITKFSKWFIY